jgi:Arc/MetJ family transcription regulator
MRTNVDIDDKLMKAAMKASGKKTKKGTIEAALQLVVKINAQRGLRSLRGKVKWEGDLDDMRRD